MVHPIHRHIRKHKKHYVRFILFFLVLVFYGMFDDILMVKAVNGDIVLSTIVISILISLLFTAIAEITGRLFGKEIKKIEKEI